MSDDNKTKISDKDRYRIWTSSPPIRNELVWNKWQQEKAELAAEVAIEIAERIDANMTHKSDAFRALFGIGLATFHNVGLQDRIDHMVKRGLYKEEADYMSCNDMVAIITTGAGRNATNMKERNIQVREHVPNLLDDEWLAIRKSIIAHPQIHCNDEWLVELDSFRPKET